MRCSRRLLLFRGELLLDVLERLLRRAAHAGNEALRVLPEARLRLGLAHAGERLRGQLAARLELAAAAEPPEPEPCVERGEHDRAAHADQRVEVRAPFDRGLFGEARAAQDG